MEKTILDILSKIQKELKAPKNQFNSFGKYNYRSCEDILEGLKPLLDQTGSALVISDEVVVLGTRFYVRATATLKNATGEISATAFARESEEKKGMDAAQITGAASSYARKYALNGLFCIDDTKDADSNGNGHKEDKPIEEISQEMQGRANEISAGFASSPSVKDLDLLVKALKPEIDVLPESLKAQIRKEYKDNKTKLEALKTGE